MRLFSFAASVFVLIGLTVQSAGAVTFSDTASYTYESSILRLANDGIVEGYANGTFKPNAAINRAELLKILIASEYPNGATNDPMCFRDIPSGSVWYARYVCYAKDLGIVEGYAGNLFRPEQTVNVAEALKMAALTFQIDLPHVMGPWYATYVKAAEDHGIPNAILRDPAHLLTRGEMTRIVDGFMPKGSSSSSSSVSSASSSSSETIRHAFMNIVQQTSPLVTSVAAGKKDVQLLKFTAIADRQDVLFTGVIFKPTQGTLNYAQNYRLKIDADGNGSYETAVATANPSGGAYLNFSNIGNGGARIEEGIFSTFVVMADLVPTYSTATFGIGFATDQTLYVTAQGADDSRALDNIETNGVCPPNAICWTRVDTMTGTQVNVTDRGDLFVTAVQDTRSHQVVAGSISDPVLRVKFRTDNEEVDIETIRFEGGNDSIEALLLYRGNDQNPFAQATQTQCSTVTSTRFCASLPSRTFLIPDEAEVTVTIRARMKNDAQGAVSGEDFSITMANSTTSFPAVEATGVTSMKDLSQNNGDSALDGEIIIGQSTAAANTTITGPTHDVVFAKIGTITNADNRPNGSPINVGQGIIGSFKITSVANTNSYQGTNDVMLNSLRFAVSLSNAEADAGSFRLASALDPSHYVTCTGGQATGTFDVTCTLTPGVIQNTIDQGTFTVYTLSANIVNNKVSSGNSSLTVSLGGFADRNAVSDVNWTDEATTFTWIDAEQTSVDSVTLKG